MMCKARVVYLSGERGLLAISNKSAGAISTARLISLAGRPWGLAKDGWVDWSEWLNLTRR